MNGGEELKEREKGMEGRKQDMTVETGKGKVDHLPTLKAKQYLSLATVPLIQPYITLQQNGSDAINLGSDDSNFKDKRFFYSSYKLKQYKAGYAN